MKTLFLFLVFTAAASAQQGPYFQCAKADGSPVPADTYTYRVGAGNYMWVPIAMPTAGKCEIEFSAYDDREDAAVKITDALGNAVGADPRVKGDIEIMIVDNTMFDQFIRGRQYGKIFTTNRNTGGTFSAKLAAGYYTLVINNRHSSLAPKSVTLTLGRGDAPPETPLNLAPPFAPFKPITRTNQMQPNETDAPPKLTKRPKTKP